MSLGLHDLPLLGERGTEISASYRVTGADPQRVTIMCDRILLPAGLPEDCTDARVCFYRVRIDSERRLIMRQGLLGLAQAATSA